MTDPRSFTFKDNLWYCEDAPQQSRPTLPSTEQGGIYNLNPRIELKGGLPVVTGAKDYGADAAGEGKK